MGYNGGKSNYDERDKLFQQSLDGKPVNRNEVKKGLNELFKNKPQGVDERCAKGHSWIRDFNEKEKCAYCRIPRPPEESSRPGFAPGTKL
jgi:hypothetical protein